MFPADGDAAPQLPIKTAREAFVPLTLVTLAAPLLWVAHFALSYLLEGFLCTRAAVPTLAIPGAIVVATVVCGGACAWLMSAGAAWLRRAGAATLQSLPFLVEAQRVLAGLALLAIVWGGTGTLFLGPCASAY